MARSKTSQRWLEEHFDDPYVKMVQRDGYRSRASCKLLEIQEKDRTLRLGTTVVDLDAASGGWSQVTSRVIGDRGRLIVSDILKMDSIPDVIFIQGDFTEDAVFMWTLEAIGDHPVDLVIFDMAPNMGGVWAADQPRIMYLRELALDLAGRVLRLGGDFLIKTFRGEGSDQYHKQAREMLDKVQMRKPLSPCDCSREQYLLAHGFRGEQTGMIDPIAYLLADDLLCRDGRRFIEGYRQCLRTRALAQYLWPGGVWPSCEAVSKTESASEGSQLNDMAKNLILQLVTAAVLVTVMNNFSSPSEPQTPSYLDFIQQVKDGKVERVTVDGYVIIGERSDGDTFKTIRPAIQDNGLTGDLVGNNVVVEGKQPEQQSIWTQLLVASFPILAIIAILMFFMRQMQGGGDGRGGPMSFGKSKTCLPSEDRIKTILVDVAGYNEAKEEISEPAEFLRDLGKFQRLSGRTPCGVLMVGPPGTGKILLTKVIAGEAKVSSFAIFGSDFVEMFVGVGAFRARDVFDQAKGHVPCIIFIGEIDAVGRHRGTGLGGGHNEREQTLSQLLVEMDGFEANDGIIVIAATNHSNVLDPASLCPGRLDRQVVVGLPDIRGREQILKVHMRKMPLDDHVDPAVIAHGTPGFSSVDLANLVNEVSPFAARSNKRIVDMHEFELAKDKTMMGAERKTMVMSEKEKRNAAYHEAGYVIVGRPVPEHDPVHKMSIILRGRAPGVIMFLPEEDRYSLSKRALESQICSLFGGCIAEKMTPGFEGITTGASNDIICATQLARDMVTKWRLSEKLGPLMYAKEEGEVFLGRNAGSQYVNVSGETAKTTNQEVRRIIDDYYGTAKRLLDENRDKLKIMVDALMRYETIGSDQIDDIMASRVLREPCDWQGSSGIDAPPANLEELGRRENIPPIGGPAGEH